MISRIKSQAVQDRARDSNPESGIRNSRGVRFPDLEHPNVQNPEPRIQSTPFSRFSMAGTFQNRQVREHRSNPGIQNPESNSSHEQGGRPESRIQNPGSSSAQTGCEKKESRIQNPESRDSDGLLGRDKYKIQNPTPGIQRAIFFIKK